jgi:hypothetical protein
LISSDIPQFGPIIDQSTTSTTNDEDDNKTDEKRRSKTTNVDDYFKLNRNFSDEIRRPKGHSIQKNRNKLYTQSLSSIDNNSKDTTLNDSELLATTTSSSSIDKYLLTATETGTATPTSTTTPTITTPINLSNTHKPSKTRIKRSERNRLAKERIIMLAKKQQKNLISQQLKQHQQNGNQNNFFKHLIDLKEKKKSKTFNSNSKK